ncbi:hybrid sensor histidine kinase/response regulator [Pseudomonas sp. UBA6310]|uniref:hybrid sensor histidine kinase/response regulator n=1 Tax=Pseudomonas sp. UBA6310 TaxID=1947327 RepID=UPI00257F3E0C|nr:PAS domain-containing sensor histidine kinase [Pseudomonas sp. UBA6310]
MLPPASVEMLPEPDRYRLLIESITDYAIYMLDVNGHVSSWNAGARRFKGYEEAEILGEHFSRFYTEEDRATGLPRRALKIAETEGRFESEGLRVRKDGTRFWCHVVIDPIRSGDGQLLGFAKVTRDLTERRAAEESLRRSEQQFRLLVQGVTDYAIYMLDTTGRITNWNAGAQRIKGYRPEEVIGQHFSLFYEEQDRASGLPDRGLRTAMNQGHFESQGWRVRKDGTRFWASVVIDPIHDDAGTLIGFAKITRDITESMEAQRALKLTEQALFESQKMEALGQLTGGVAHDFNNLLMVILGSLEIARKRLPDDARITPLLNNAIQGAQRGASLTRRMLAFARRQELSLELIDLAGMMHGMSDLLHSSLGSAIHIETRFPLDLPPVKADVNQLELAILNLAVNARDAMPGGGVLTIEARQRRHAGDQSRLQPGDYVCLSLTDTGVGMDAETLARATEPFFTTKGAGKGTGLGLSMVHGLVEQMGGRLLLSSRVPGGTTAELWLPLAAQAPSEAPRQSEAASRLAVQAKTVLVVDDDPLVLTSTAAMLDDLGYGVDTANSGEEALERLAAGGIDILVTDQAMPGMSGTELIDRARALHGSLPALIVTGIVEDACSGLPRLSKPFDQRALSQALDALERTKPQ